MTDQVEVDPAPKLLDAQKPQVAGYIPITEQANAVLDSLKLATKVVGWYPHSEDGTVRGPFCRWFTISDVQPEYRKHVGHKSDDAKYAAYCMNYAPSLAEAMLSRDAEMLALEKDFKHLARVHDLKVGEIIKLETENRRLIEAGSYFMNIHDGLGFDGEEVLRHAATLKEAKP